MKVALFAAMCTKQLCEFWLRCFVKAVVSVSLVWIRTLFSVCERFSGWLCSSLHKIAGTFLFVAADSEVKNLILTSTRCAVIFARIKKEWLKICEFLTVIFMWYRICMLLYLLNCHFAFNFRCHLLWFTISVVSV